MIVVADTSPLNYLILIGHVDVFETLYGEVVIPPAVQDEMLDPLAPPAVRAWMKNPPHWLGVRTPSRLHIALSSKLDDGEREAITLAHSGGVGTTLLIDEQIGRREALRVGLKVTGTLGVLEEASKLGLLNLREAIAKLRATTFKASDELYDQFLKCANE